MAGSPNAQAPEWAMVQMMAQDYGIPPWQIEAEATQEWVRRWLAWKQAESQESERKAKKWRQKP